MRIIGLMGAEQVGKSTAAAFLRKKGFQTVSFAGPLKRMLETLGLTFHELHGCDKETPSDILCGRTPRYAMQTLGTEWGRDRIGGDIWIEAFKRDLLDQEYQPLKSNADGSAPEKKPGLYIIEDVRFDNEVRAIRELGGEIWLVRRPHVEPDMRWVARLLRLLGLKARLHPSSTGWARMTDADRVLWNGEGKDDYDRTIAQTYDAWRYDQILRSDFSAIEETDATSPADLRVKDEDVVVLGAVAEEILSIDAHDEQKIRFACDEMNKAFGVTSEESFEAPSQDATAPAVSENFEPVEPVLEQAGPEPEPEPEPEPQAAEAQPREPMHQQRIVAVMKPIYVGEVAPEIKAQDEVIAQAMLQEAVTDAVTPSVEPASLLSTGDRAEPMPAPVVVDVGAPVLAPQMLAKSENKKRRRRR